MVATNLKIAAVVVFTLGTYTLVANSIPQVESEVPEELELSADFTVEELVSAGERLYQGAGGCEACHGLGTRAPRLLSSEGDLGPIGARCGDRVAGTPCKEYLHESLVDPNAHVVEGYAPIMPDMSRTLSEQQIWALVAFLESQGGEVTVGPGDLEGAAGAGAAAAEGPGAGAAGAVGAAAGPAPPTTSSEPREILDAFACLQCHQFEGQGAPIGPPFADVGARLDPAAIRRSILFPAADTSAGYEQMAGLMPTNFGDRMTAAQLEALVEFLAEQR
jgi:mono/diheme cytochrome c family protein